MYDNEFKTRGKGKTKTYWNKKLTATHTYLPTLPFKVGLTGLLGPHYLVNINIEEEDGQQSASNSAIIIMTRVVDFSFQIYFFNNYTCEMKRELHCT